MDSNLTLPPSSSIRLWTNGGNEKFSNVALSMLDNNKITPAVPEPTTATLSLLALAGLAARRRRR